MPLSAPGRYLRLAAPDGYRLPLFLSFIIQRNGEMGADKIQLESHDAPIKKQFHLPTLFVAYESSIDLACDLQVKWFIQAIYGSAIR